MRKKLNFSKSVSFTVVLLLAISMCLGFTAMSIGDSIGTVFAEYAYPTTGDAANYVNTNNFTNEDSAGFPSSINTKNARGGATIAEGMVFGQSNTISLDNFDVASGFEYDSSRLKFDNGIYYDEAKNPSNDNWKYVYAYVRLPERFATSAGVVTFEADTRSYCTTQNERIKKYLTIVAGNEMWGLDDTSTETKTRFNTTDLRLDKSTMVTNVADSPRAAMQDADRFNTTHQSVSTTVPQGAKYVRVSFLEMCESSGGDGSGFKFNNASIKFEETVKPDYQLESMGNIWSGSNVRYEANNYRGENQYNRTETNYQYYPTQYLMPNAFGKEISLDSFLTSIPSSSTSEHSFDTSNKNRLIGVERKGGLNIHYQSEKGGVWVPEAGFNGGQLGTGFFANWDDQNDERAAAFYFTVALPDHMVPTNDNIEIDWSYNVRMYGNSSRQAGSGYAIYADTNAGAAATIQGKINDSVSSQGFQHSGCWWGMDTKGNPNPHYYVIEDKSKGLTCIKSGNSMQFNGEQTKDKAEHIKVRVPANTKFLRFVVAFDQEGSRWYSKSQFSLTNMRLTLNDTGAKLDPTVSLTPENTDTNIVQSKKMTLRANSANLGLPTQDVTRNITIHAINPYTGAEMHVPYDELPDNGDGQNVVWRTNSDLGTTTKHTNAAGDNVTKNVKGIGCNTEIYTKASKIWVTYAGVADEKYKNANVPGIDTGAPVIGEPEQLVQVAGGHNVNIKVAVTDDSAITGATIDGVKADIVDGYILVNNITAGVDYTITATDQYGYTSTKVINIAESQIDTTGPTIADIVGYQTGKNASDLAANVTDGAGITRVYVTNNNDITKDMTIQNGKYYVDGLPGGTYYIKATDNYGNESSTQGIVITLDTAAPEVTGLNGTYADNSIGNKTITFTVKDASNNNPVRVTGNDGLQVVDKGNGTYEVNVGNGTYSITVADKFENAKTVEFSVSNCYPSAIPGYTVPREDVKVRISRVGGGEVLANGDSIVVFISSTNPANRIIEITSVGTIEENHNYGLEAQYTITYNDNKTDTNIVVNIENPIMVDITFGEDKRTVGFGETVECDAAVDPAKEIFVGWFNGDVLVSSNEHIVVTATRDITLTPRKVAKNDIMIKYTNLAGKVLDIRTYSAGNISDILKNSDVPTPVSPFETFAGWQVMSEGEAEGLNGQRMTVVEARTSYTPNKTFEIHINMEDPIIVNANEHVSLIDLMQKNEIDTNGILGWRMENNVVVSRSQDYEFYAVANVQFYAIKRDAELKDTEMTIMQSESTVGDLPVIVLSGKTNDDVVYNEIGFLVVEETVPDDYIKLYNNKYALRLHTPSVTKGQNMVILKKDVFLGNKVVMYTIDTAGNIKYSAVETINGGTL